MFPAGQKYYTSVKGNIFELWPNVFCLDRALVIGLMSECGLWGKSFNILVVGESLLGEQGISTGRVYLAQILKVLA